MVNDVRELLQGAVASPPQDATDLGTVLASGRRRVRRRRRVLVAGVAAVAAVSVGSTALSLQGTGGPDQVANRTVPTPDGPVLGLADAGVAREGADYDVLASYTNDDLDAANGRYYDGVTDDGLILFRDGPHGPENATRYALLDPATGAKDWLPASGITEQVLPVLLDADRLVLLAVAVADPADDLAGRLRAHVFDRDARTWRTLTWADLPDVSDAWSAEPGPGGRLFIGVPATDPGPPPGGWPTGPDGEADDSGAEGETQDLWSVSLTDRGDVRDEGLRYGELAFTDDAMVWTATSNGTNDRIHVRDLATGAERDFDPRSGERCNLLGLGAVGDSVVLSQYCGTYDDGRDDRVQVLTTHGDPVTTIQGDGIGGRVAGGFVQVTSYSQERPGTFVYDPDTGRFLRGSDGVSSWSLGGPTPAGMLLWDTPYGTAPGPQEPVPGATQWLVRWRS